MSEIQHYDPLWLEFAPISKQAASRLLIFFHAPGADAGAFAPVALHWHLKFPSATALIMESTPDPNTGLPAWFGNSASAGAPNELVRRIHSAQRAFSIGHEKTIIVAHGGSASLLLETLRTTKALAHIVVSYGGRFASAIKPSEQFEPIMHLIHGELDAQVPVIHAQQAITSLKAVGADVTLDILVDGSHVIDQEMINVGTTRVMQTVFRGRQKPKPGGWQLH